MTETNRNSRPLVLSLPSAALKAVSDSVVDGEFNVDLWTVLAKARKSFPFNVNQQPTYLIKALHK